MRLVDEEDWADVLCGEVLDVGAHGEEEISCGGRLRETESEAEVSIEIAPTDGGILTVDEAEVGWSEGVAEGTQDAGLASTRLSSEQDAPADMHRIGEVFDEGLLGRRHPELGVADVLREGMARDPKVREVIETHG